MTVVTNKPEGMCSGRNCNKTSIGSFNEVKEVPKWRCVDDRPENHIQFDLVTKVYYCAEHEQIAKSYSRSTCS
jgi:hypothetical protein